MCDNLESTIYYIVDSFCIRNHYMIVIYYVALFVSLFINYLSYHYFT
jgi:hypothetical protein